VEVTPLNTVDYFQTLTATMGGPDQTATFARLFMLPGMAHCRRGPGADAVDWLSYLEAWVETDRPPDELIAHHLIKEQTYLGLPRPRFPLAPDEFDRRSTIRPYSSASR
jgi:feruloyl esterase